MREGNRHPARISPDIEHLHHHRRDLLEETGEEGRRLRERKKVKERGKRGRGRLGVRDGGGEGRGVGGTECCETKKTETGRKKQRE